jgi:NTP pyrophosphatase (non-canonical NTP hydrolase)
MERILNEERTKKCKEILDHFGFDAQQDKLVEECDELIEAAQGDDYGNFIEEMADVTIMLTQMFLSLDEEQRKKFDETIDYKLDRTLKRIKSE